MRDASDPQVYADWIRVFMDSARRDPPEYTRRLAILDWRNHKNRPMEWLLAGYMFARYLDARGLPAAEVLRIARWYADAPDEDCRRSIGALAASVRDWPAFVELVRLGLGLPEAPAAVAEPQTADEEVTGFPVRFASGRFVDVDTGAEVVRLDVAPGVYAAALDVHLTRVPGGRPSATFCGRVLSRMPTEPPDGMG